MDDQGAFSFPADTSAIAVVILLMAQYQNVLNSSASSANLTMIRCSLPMCVFFFTLVGLVPTNCGSNAIRTEPNDDEELRRYETILDRTRHSAPVTRLSVESPGRPCEAPGDIRTNQKCDSYELAF